MISSDLVFFFTNGPFVIEVVKKRPRLIYVFRDRKMMSRVYCTLESDFSFSMLQSGMINMPLLSNSFTRKLINSLALLTYIYNHFSFLMRICSFIGLFCEYFSTNPPSNSLLPHFLNNHKKCRGQ